MPEPSEQSAALRTEALALLREMVEVPGDAVLPARIEAWRARSALHERCWQQVLHQWAACGAVQPRPQGIFDRAWFALDLGWERLCARVAAQPALAGVPAFCLLLVLMIPLLRQGEPVPLQAPGPVIKEVATEVAAQETPVVALELSSPAQEQRIYTLEDGSTVTLNWNSAVTVTLSDTFREIVLHRGEALFAVAPDRTRPFTVAAGTVQARAVGTAFAVRHEGETSASITVREGIVEVTAPAAAAVQLRMDQRVEAGPGRIGQVLAVDAASAVAWSEGMLIFRERPLSEVLAELGRYTTRELDAGAIRNADLPVTATYFTDRADDALQLVAEAFELRLVPGAGGKLLVESAATPSPQ